MGIKVIEKRVLKVWVIIKQCVLDFFFFGGGGEGGDNAY